MGAVGAHFLVPKTQVVVGYLPGSVKDEDAELGSVVVGGVQLVEGLLTGRVPEICGE